MENLKTNYRELALSQLSFIILSEKYTGEEQDKATQEIERRFSRNGCRFVPFMDYEEEAIKERGKDISAYLISPNPSGQQLMDVYFKYVYDNKLFGHGDLLYSEIMLCNEDSQNSFFTEALGIELKKISDRLKENNLSSEEYGNLKLIYSILRERYYKKQLKWYENSLSECVMDIIPHSNSFISPIREKKLEIINKEFETRKYSLKWLPFLTLHGIFENDLINHLNLQRIAYSDYLKLSKQKDSILTSLEDYEVDYTSVEPLNLVLKKHM